MLMWTARAFALAAALQAGNGLAQETEAPATPELQQAPPAADVRPGVQESAQDTLRQGRQAVEQARERAQQEAAQQTRDPLTTPEPPKPLDEQSAPAAEQPRDATSQQAPLEDLPEPQQRARQREAGTAPDPNTGRSDAVRSATQHLQIDEDTRSRYRWHNGEWWFQMRSGGWKIHRDGSWQDFDPATYQPRSGSAAPPTQNYGSNSPAPVSGASGGYSYQSPQYYGGYSTLPPGGTYYAPTYSYGYRPGQPYFGPQYRPGWRDGYYGGRYYDGSGRYGYGYRDSYYDGRWNRGRFDNDRYRGAVIGSEIGGQLGGRSGAIIGGVLGAEAAD